MFQRLMITGLLIVLLTPVFAQNVQLELLMPDDSYTPGTPFFLDLYINNFGESFYGAQLYLALTLGTDEYWFYPAWQKYPPGIAWENIDIVEFYQVTTRIIPEFAWPDGAGTFNGAGFIAAVLHNGSLVSNVVETSFGWMVGSKPDMVYIPPGTFQMGSPLDEPCRDDFLDLELQHEVTLTCGFYMMTIEVNRQMWADLEALYPDLPPDPSSTIFSPTMNHPLQCATWYEAVLYANLLSLRDGLTMCYYKDAAFTIPLDVSNYFDQFGFLHYCNFGANGYRLPTEAEWEYAARAGSTGPFYEFEPNYRSSTCRSCPPNPSLEILDSIAWWCGNSGSMHYPGGMKSCNSWGLFDMYGNVPEWCWDWEVSYSPESVIDPLGSQFGYIRVCRGGGFRSDAHESRSASRYGDEPGYRGYGFRLVRTAE